MRVRNPLDRAVSGEFPPFGVIVIGSGEARDIPDAVWAVWRDAGMWGGKDCPLQEEDGEGGVVAEAAPPSNENEAAARNRPVARRRRKR